MDSTIKNHILVYCLFKHLFQMPLPTKFNTCTESFFPKLAISHVACISTTDCIYEVMK